MRALSGGSPPLFTVIVSPVARDLPFGTSRRLPVRTIGNDRHQQAINAEHSLSLRLLAAWVCRSFQIIRLGTRFVTLQPRRIGAGRDPSTPMAQRTRAITRHRFGPVRSWRSLNARSFRYFFLRPRPRMRLLGRINGWSAPSRGLSQPPTSFFGSWRQGIHRVPFVS
jgi:hypothetical protein